MEERRPRFTDGGTCQIPESLTGWTNCDRSPGRKLALSDWIEVSQEMINRFADLTGDHQWIHVDVERARKETPFGSTIAHGFLTVSLLSEFSRRTVEVRGDFKMRINYGFNKLRFVSPVPAGSKIRARFTPQKVTDNEVTWQVTVEVEGQQKPALVAEWLGRFY